MDHRNRICSFSAAVAVLAVVLSVACTEAAYVSSASLRQSSIGKIRYSPVVKTAGATSGGRGVSKRRDDGSAVTLYLFPSPPSAMNNGGRRQRSRRRTDSQPVRTNRSSSKLQATSMLSDSVLAPCDTLPSFHTAHGLLSPEVVMKIDAANDDIEVNGPLHRFLKTYKSSGPMACLPLLSDADVLPELTRAMRDIIA